MAATFPHTTTILQENQFYTVQSNTKISTIVILNYLKFRNWLRAANKNYMLVNPGTE